ncbi:hypothetical protein GCM10011507_32190 [Edaphobacter acidisoli]|uniref:PASTA domain-containing protein n=1 Tax=Edaphobacter acidisoli TaxID=2040573 RepID=A0A916S078_9BACT|nr:PASTA domain-containing protein [Edaphobacter acidisoli]GGA78526.1 hypothetical protein GCM10011507_32190 [Edaphobacter acidisoli]
MKVSVRAINRFFNIIVGALAMFAVFLTSAFITMRLFIHGREVKVPILIGQSMANASEQARSHGLRLILEDRFYSSNTSPGIVLGQSPAAGTTVRRQSIVRVTESLGAQQVAVPNLIGESERTASINLRRVQLEVGTIAYVQAPGDPGTVIAQTPEANASGIDRPRVSLLLSQPKNSAAEQNATAGQTIGQNAPQATSQDPAFVMPSLVGLPLMTAATRASAAGLRIASAEEIKPTAASTTTPTATTTASSTPTTAPTVSPAPATPATPVAGSSTATVVAQTPPAGYRVTKGDAVHLSIAY